MVEHVYPNSDHTKRKNPDLSKKRREKKFLIGHHGGQKLKFENLS